MKYIIMADGEGKRWNNYMGVPKHLIELNGERLIDRTVRLLKEVGIEDIWITTHDERLHVSGINIYEPTNNLEEIDKFLSNEPIWTKNVLFVYGDVYYTEDAIKAMVSCPMINDFKFCGRFGAHKYTKKDFGEIFGLKFLGDSGATKVREGCKAVHRYLESGGHRGSGWELYKAMHNAEDMVAHQYFGNFEEINDLTDDFDCPSEYEDFINNYKKAK